MRGINNGFEDREGHQAPFTLPGKENVLEYWSNGVLEGGAPAKPGEGSQRIGSPRPLPHSLGFFDCANDGVEVRPIAGFKFGMKELSIDADLKCAAARGNERERLDAFAEFENFGRQTDGLRCVVSNHAIFDRHFGLHFELLSERSVSIGESGSRSVAPVCSPVIVSEAKDLAIEAMNVCI
jgi:hypothetical protein